MEGEPMKSNHGSFGEPRRVTCTGPRVPQSLLLDGIVPQYQEKRKEKNNYKGAGIKPGEKPVKLCFRRASLPWRGGGAEADGVLRGRDRGGRQRWLQLAHARVG